MMQEYGMHINARSMQKLHYKPSNHLNN